MRATFLLGVLGIAVAAVAGAVGCEQRRPPRFPHGEHLAKGPCGQPGQPPCPTCLTCHAGIRQSEAQAIAPLTSCAKCHSPGSPQVAASRERLAAAQRPERGIEFVHADHVGLPQIAGQCVGCHEGVVGGDTAAEVFPPMAECLTCHADEFAQAECVPCHDRSALRKLVPVTFMRHDVAFLRDHGNDAARQEQVCNQCHAQAKCLACHDQGQTIAIEQRLPDALDREFVHRGAFVGRHAIEARSSPARCMRCHTPSSCDSCHLERGVSGAARGAIHPHPRGWIGPNPASPTFHGTAARRDIVSCAACHDHGPATNCIECHRVGGHAGSPHPPGWRSSQSSSSRMCRYCHGS